MTKRDAVESALAGMERAGKAMELDDVKSLHEPVGFFFQESYEGTVLFIILKSPPCRHGACTFCGLTETSTTREMIIDHYGDQIDFIFKHRDVHARASEIVKVIVSNQGSVLDEDTFPSVVLNYLFYKMARRLQNLKIVCLESRPEYVDDHELETFRRFLQEVCQDIQLEIAIGYEAHDTVLRNTHLNKGLVLREKANSLEHLCSRMAENGFLLKCYFMQKPWMDMTDEEAIKDVKGGIDFLVEMMGIYSVQVSMHLNPTFAAKGTLLADAYEHGTFVPPTLLDLTRAALHAEGRGLPMFLGLNDEGLAVPGGSFLREEDLWMVEILEEFNRTQEFGLLHDLIAEATATDRV